VKTQAVIPTAAVDSTPVRVFLAGATGVIGSQLVPLLVDAGHHVTGMTRSPGKAASLVAAGADPVVCDVFDVPTLAAAVGEAHPDLVMHQLTDLPDDWSQFDEHAAAHNRIRREGTHNLVAAARAAAAERFFAQSVAFELPGEGGAAVADLEAAVLAYPGVVLRYGRFFGPGTYHREQAPPPPRIHVAEAARRTVVALSAAPGIVTVVEE